MNAGTAVDLAKQRGTAAIVDLEAIRHNVRVLRSAAPNSQFMAVVKANGYGHGAEQVARAALEAGAAWLGVALVSEAVALREAGIIAPILVLSEPPSIAFAAAARHGIDVTVGSAEAVGMLCDNPRGGTGELRVHLKVDTGMSRMGVAVAESVALATRLQAAAGVTLAGVFTHLACADADDSSSADAQLDLFDEVLHALAAAGVEPELVHAANSAGTVFLPRSHRDLVRCGIAIYGLDPNPHRAERSFDRLGLRPALGLASYVSAVRELRAGQGVSYGHRFVAARPTRLATVPIGYADGVPRGLGAAGTSVLLGGRRRRIAGVVTMDQLMVDCTEGPCPRLGDSVVLLGSQGAEAISASDWATTMDTINYEVVCGVSSRVPRLYVDATTAVDHPDDAPTLPGSGTA